MATITIDPLNRIEGHLKATVVVNDGTGVVEDAQLTGNLFRGFELILNRRDPRDAPQITQRICGVCPTPHGLTSARSLDTALGITNDPGISTAGDIDGYSTQIPDNGRIVRNIIHGIDMAGDHITHFYHLSALDFINTTTFPGMAPWLPSYTYDSVAGDSALGSTLVVHYVQALTMRRKMHTAQALFAGRMPIQNAIVPGGVTTLFSSTYPLNPQTGTDYDLFGPFNVDETKSRCLALLNDVRDFIDSTYIPDVVTVAGAYPQYWSAGVGCGNLLSYGDFPIDGAGTLAIKRGLTTGFSASYTGFDQANISEYVAGSYYNYGILDPAGLHPFDGKTTPNMGSGGYSWLKAPRYMVGTTPTVCEVGPLARMVVSVAAGSTVAATSKNALLGIGAGGSYTVGTLVTNALSAVGQPIGSLFSVLGRHAARALEAKYLADLAAGWVGLVDASPAYTYKRIPKQISAGYGLSEAPRGALGHWIKIEGRKIAKYQCVVPTTWNASPKDVLGQNGPAELALIGSNIGTNATSQVVNILRILHPFDFCIACAVHVVTPEGKEKMKFAIDPQGRPINAKRS